MKGYISSESDDKDKLVKSKDFVLSDILEFLEEIKFLSETEMFDVIKSAKDKKYKFVSEKKVKKNSSQIHISTYQ